MQKILDIVEDLKRGGTGGSSNSLSGLSDNSLLQVFNALNELKNQLQVRDHNLMKMMGDLRFESGKTNTRLGEILKAKASRDKVRGWFSIATNGSSNSSMCSQAVAKILSVVEEQKRDSVNDMKTLSNMNTLLQVSYK